MAAGCVTEALAFQSHRAVHIEDCVVVFRLLQLSGRALAAEARCLGSIPGNCWFFTFLCFCLKMSRFSFVNLSCKTTVVDIKMTSFVCLEFCFPCKYIMLPAPPCILYVSLCHLFHPGYNSFLGVEVVGEEQLLVTNEGMNFQWKDHGFKLHVPKNALPEDIPEYSVNIKASLAGQFELPEGYELVSAVYWVKTQGKFQKPTTIEVQHCANFSNPNQLYFVRTSCAQKSLPYKFKFINGGSFISENKYGALSITHFSGIGVVKEVKHDEHSCQYCAQVYFTDKHLGGCWYYCHFVVTKDLEMCLTVSDIKLAIIDFKAMFLYFRW